MSSICCLCRLYSQIHLEKDKMPDKATESVERQLEELRQVAAKRLILVVLDGLCSYICQSHVHLFYLLIRHVGRGTRAPIFVHRP